MGFLIYPDDFDSAIKEPRLAGVIEGNVAYLNDAMSRAQATVRGFTKMRYNMAAMFNQAGATRDNLLIQFMVALTLYNIHKRIDAKMMPEQRKKDYDDTMALLREIQGGKFQADWVENTDDDKEPESGRRFVIDERPFRTDW